MAVAISSVGEGNIWPAGGILQPLTDCLNGTACGPALFEGSPWIFFILTLIIGGGCAIMAGRGLAVGWQPARLAVLYALLLAAAVRFLHFGLLKGTLLSPYYYVLDAIVLVLLAVASYRATRARQMSTQYPWLYKRNGPFGWTAAPQASASTAPIAATNGKG